jgi:hypothetical protein
VPATALLAGLAGLVGIGLLSPAPRTAVPAAGPPVAQPVAQAAPPGTPLWQAVRPSVTVSHPRAESEVRGGRVTIAGVVDGGAAHVIVSVRNRREHLLDQVTVATNDGQAFGAIIKIPGPADGEDRRRVWLEVIAYDAANVPVAGLVRPLSVVRPEYRLALPRVLGEDGGVGILGVDLPAEVR